MKRFFDGGIPFLIMFVLYPMLYFMSQNFYAFTFLQYLVALSFLLLLLVFSCAFVELLFLFLNKIKINSPKFRIRLSILKKIVYIILAIVFLHFIFTPGKLYNIPLGVINKLISTFILGYAVVTLTITKKLRIVNGLLIICTIYCIAGYCGAITLDYIKYKKFAGSFVSNEPVKIKFKTKPNVYYFYMESYHGKEALKQLFDFDNAQMYDYLKKNNFKVYDNTYSNYDATVPSILSTFLMKHHYYIFETGVMDTGLYVKDIIGGNSQNTVVNVFRKNGYSINYIFATIAFHLQPQNLDFCNFETHMYYLLSIQKNLYIKKNAIGFRQLNEYINYIKKEMISIKEKRSSPCFFFIQMGSMKETVNHIPGRAIIWREGDLYEMNKKLTTFNEDYVRNMKLQNEEFVMLLDYIIKNDPNALIIVMGDHGSFKYRNIDSFGMKKMKEYMAWEKIDGEAFANSLFNVILAIKYPENVTVPKVELLSNVNVFRTVFSALAEDEKLLKNKEEDISYTKNVIAVKDGKLLKEPIELDVVDYGKNKLKGQKNENKK